MMIMMFSGLPLNMDPSTSLLYTLQIIWIMIISHTASFCSLLSFFILTPFITSRFFKMYLFIFYLWGYLSECTTSDGGGKCSAETEPPRHIHSFLAMRKRRYKRDGEASREMEKAIRHHQHTYEFTVLYCL